MTKSSRKPSRKVVSAQEISERYIAECKKDMDGMNVKPATTNPQGIWNCKTSRFSNQSGTSGKNLAATR